MRGQREKGYCPEEQFSASLSWEARILDLLGTRPTEQPTHIEPMQIDCQVMVRTTFKNDPRYPFEKPKVDNANYLWIQVFLSALSPTG